LQTAFEDIELPQIRVTNECEESRNSKADLPAIEKPRCRRRRGKPGKITRSNE